MFLVTLSLINNVQTSAAQRLQMFLYEKSLHSEFKGDLGYFGDILKEVEVYMISFDTT